MSQAMSQLEDAIFYVEEMLKIQKPLPYIPGKSGVIIKAHGQGNPEELAVIRGYFKTLAKRCKYVIQRATFWRWELNDGLSETVKAVCWHKEQNGSEWLEMIPR